MTYNLSLAEPDLTLAVPVVVAQPSPSPTPEEPRGEDVGKSSPVGFVVLILFFIAVAFLVRSMNKHLKRVPATFDKPEDKDEPADEPEKPQDVNGKPGPA